MLRRLIALALTILLPGAALAANKYVRSDGTATWANATSHASASTSASLTTANANAAAGDNVFMASGSYPVGVAPVNSGTAGNRIVFMGPQGDSSSVVVPSLSLSDRDYVTVKWLHVTGSASVTDNGGASFSIGDSLYFLSIGGGLELVGTYGLTIANVRGGKANTGNNGRFNHGKTTPGSGVGFTPTNTKIYDSRFYYGTSDAACGPAIRWDRVRNADVKRTHFIAYVDPGTSNGACVHGQIMYNVANSTFEDVRWEHANKSSVANGYIWNYRDSSTFNVATRCTVLTDTTGSGSSEFAMVTSGAHNNSCADNQFVDCVFNIDGLFRSAGAAQRYTFTGCQITYGYDGSNSHSLVGTSLVFRHNTLVAKQAHSGANPWVWDQPSSDPFNGATITDNIFVTTRHTAVDAPFAWNYSGSNTITRNLFWNYSDSTTTNSIVRYNGANRSVGPAGTACSSNGFECASVFANPIFRNRGNLDYAPLGGSPALGGTWPDGYVGALDASGVAPDTCNDISRPGKIADLSSSYVFTGGMQSANVQIGTVPGEHQFTGSGNYTSVTIKRSASPITEANWASATTVYTFSVLDHDGPGQPMSVVDQPIAPGVWYYAAKPRSDSTATPIFGCLSNVDTVNVPAMDLTRPAPITTLTASSPWPGFVRLQWTAVGDDSLTGTASRYDIRLRLGEPITGANWDDTTHTTTFTAQGRTYHFRYPDAEPSSPSVAGTTDTLRAVLGQGRVAYFAMKVMDDAGYWSALSNSESTLVRSSQPADEDRFVYGGAGPTQPNRVAPAEIDSVISKAWPAIYYDSLTINTAELDKLARFNVVCFNPDLFSFDSSSAAVRYLRKKNPRIKVLVEPVPDAAYAQTSADTAMNNPKTRGSRLYYWRKWNALRDVTPWPTHFAYPYSPNYGIPAGYVAGSDTTSPLAWLMASGAGRKNAMLGTITGAATASAGITLRNANLAYRNAQGRYLVAERLAELDAELFYNRWYTDENGVQRRLVDGVFNDLHSYGITGDPSGAGWGDIVDFARAGVSPWGYSSRSNFNAGWTAGAIRYDIRLRELTPEWEWYPSNAGGGVGYEAATGRMREGFPAQDGGSWGTNAHWVPSGAFHDEAVYRNSPRMNSVFVFPSLETLGDSGMVAGFSPDTNWARKDYRFGWTSARQWGAAFVYAWQKGAIHHGQGHAKGAYYNWVFDEQRVNRTTSQALGTEAPDSAGWLGAPRGAAYQHYPGSAGALFTSTFPDSIPWGTSLQKNANGRVTMRPTTYDGMASVGGSTYMLEIIPATVWPSNYDYQVGAIADGARFRVDNGGVYTVSGWARADSVRWLNLWFRDSTGATAKAGNENLKRIMVGKTWAPFAMTITATVASARRVALAIAAGDTLGRVLVTGLQVHPGDSLLSIREYEGGVVMTNPSLSISKSHTFGRYTRRLIARPGVWQDVNNGALARTVTVPASDGIALTWPADSTRPRAVTDLASDAVTCDGATLSWTATGDDSLTGRALSYEIRVRTGGAVTDGNWNSAAVAASGPCVDPGAKQSVIVVTGLGASATWWAALRVYDEAGYPSVTSNSVSFTTSSPCSPSAPGPSIRVQGSGGRTRVRIR